MKTFKRRTAKVLSFCLVLTMILGMTPTAYATVGVTRTSGIAAEGPAVTPVSGDSTGITDPAVTPSSGVTAQYGQQESEMYYNTMETYLRRVVGFKPSVLTTSSTVNYDDQISAQDLSDGDTGWVDGFYVTYNNPETGEYRVEGMEEFGSFYYTPTGGGGGGGGGGSDDDDYDDYDYGGGDYDYWEPEPEPYYPPPHYCSFVSSTSPLNDNDHITSSYCTGCGASGGSSTSPHSKSFSYTQVSDSQHRTYASCSVCGWSKTYNENHSWTNRGAEVVCSQCGYSYGVDVTWHYYDEHTPVTTVTRQKWGSGLKIPAARGRQDYKFTGWYTEWGGIGSQPTAGQKVNRGCVTDYYASWKAIIIYDIEAPIITVTRNPASIDKPTKTISLTITAKDVPHPETGETHNHALPLQIEGETTWHASPYTISVTENKPIMIVARDTKGNTREFLVDINNLDTSAPVINGFTQDTTGWTKKPVTVRIDASDDQALHVQPYRWEFTPNRTGTPVVGQWTATPTYTVTEAGKVRVQVRDAVGNPVWSDYYYVNNVDTTPPSLDPNQPYTVSTTATVAASTGVTITLNLWDKPDNASGMSSGLAAAPIKWVNIDGIFSTTRTVTVHRNGTYNVVLKDAVGNESAFIPITISNISTSEPVINSVTATDVDGDVINPLLPGPGDKAPITLTVSASFGDAGEPEKPYSYDGGLTWTSLPHTTVNGNGEYTVTIRDANGTQKTESIILNTVDSADPIAGMYLFKGQPDDWVDRFGSTPCTERDWVWKLRVDASDVGGSGIQSVYCQWDGVTLTPDQLPRTFDVKTPGTYQITVTDNAGHEIQAEKVVQWTDLSESVFGPNPEVPVTTPDVGGSHDWDSGSAGQPYNANLEDLVFGPTGAYNTSTGTFTPYPAGMEGIPVHFNAGITRNKWGTATVSFNNKEYRATWLSADVTGDIVTRQDYDGKANAKVLGTGNSIPGYAFIPISDITGDMKNARIRVTVREWNDEACTDLNKEGTENFYTSVQNSKPTITYTYNRGSDEMTVIATSALSGIQTVTWQFDSGTENTYTGPFPLGTTPPTTITLKAKDNLGIETTLNIDVANLGLLGNTTGMPATGTLSTDAISNGTSASHSSNRAADIFIIGGTRGNTETVPGANVFDQALAG